MFFFRQKYVFNYPFSITIKKTISLESKKLKKLKTRKNPIAECPDYQITVTQLRGAKGRWRYRSIKARL